MKCGHVAEKARHSMPSIMLCRAFAEMLFKKEGRYNKISNRGNLTLKENCDAGSQLLCYLDNIIALIAITFKTYFCFFEYSVKLLRNITE